MRLNGFGLSDGTRGRLCRKPRECGDLAEGGKVTGERELTGW